MLHVYILTNRKHGTLFTSVISELAASINLLRSGLGSAFLLEHRLLRLVYLQPLPQVPKQSRRKSGSNSL